MKTDGLIEVRKSAAGETVYIAGTRTPVRHVVGYYKMLLDEIVIERICQTLPYLSPDQVHAALDYWRAHEDVIAREQAEDEAALARLQKPA